MPFEFERLELEGLVLIRPKVFRDERGFFLEFYKRSEFYKNGIEVEFLQDNHSASVKGTLRGLHYQKKPKVQGKLVRCVKGDIFDVAVDIRKGSKTFGKWFGIRLSEENQLMLWIPPGFAHGFLVLSDYAEVIYKVSHSEYSPGHDAGIRFDDPDLAIDWPIKDPNLLILSEKDKRLPYLKDLKEEDLL